MAEPEMKLADHFAISLGSFEAILRGHWGGTAVLQSGMCRNTGGRSSELGQN